MSSSVTSHTAFPSSVCMFVSRVLRASHSSATRSTVNEAEIARFSKLSSQWWDEEGELQLLHKMNPIRMQFIRQKLLGAKYDDGLVPDMTNDTASNPLNGLHVLDVGCGGGLLSESLARSGARTLGIDAAASNIAIAQAHASADPKLTSTLSYLHTAAESLLPEPKRYDVVFSMEVVEHVDNPVSFLETCAELVKPGGHLFLSTVSRTPLAYLLTIFFAEHVLRLVPAGTHTYSKYIKPSELIEFFKSYRSPGGQPWINPKLPVPTRTEAEVRGMIYNPLQARWILAPRDAFGATECNYVFWIRKPKL